MLEIVKIYTKIIGIKIFFGPLYLLFFFSFINFYLLLFILKNKRQIIREVK